MEQRASTTRLVTITNCYLSNCMELVCNTRLWKVLRLFNTLKMRFADACCGRLSAFHAFLPKEEVFSLTTKANTELIYFMNGVSILCTIASQ